ncbi:MAG TPA: prevent-host-death protein [Thermoleophilia bacterium]|nr:prevent-host-death protein [Thermoleophilia bacterium]
MRMMSIRELRDSLASIDALVDEAGEILVTRHGRPVARMSSMKPGRTAPSHADLRATMPRMTTLSEALVRAERDCDRNPMIAES